MKKCKCGCNDFILSRKMKLICQKCDRIWNPFSIEYHKVMEPDGFHYFWVKLTPQFIDRLETSLPDLDMEQVLKDTITLKKDSKQNRTYACKYHGKHIFWKLKFNHKLKRLELELIMLTPPSVLELRYEKKVEIISPDFGYDVGA